MWVELFDRAQFEEALQLRVYAEIQQFFSAYSKEWRLVKLLALKHLIENKDDLSNSDFLGRAPEVMEYIMHNSHRFHNTDGYIYTVVHKGLHMEALATAHMYAEDLGGFLISARTAHGGCAQNFPDKFLDYQEKDVFKFYKEEVPGLSKADCCTYLCYPTDKELERRLRASGNLEEMKAKIKESCKLFKKTLMEIRAAFLKNREFFQQYKHGNKVIITPFEDVTADNIEEIKQNRDALLCPLRRKKYHR